MLVKLTELIETDGFYEDRQQPYAVDPLAIDAIRPGELQGYNGPCCVLHVPTVESPVVVAGDLDSILSQLQLAEQQAAAKLEAIRQILDAPCLSAQTAPFDSDPASLVPVHDL